MHGESMDTKLESYWRPQVLRHITKGETEEFAVHEVHYFDFGNNWGPSTDAVSSRFPTVDELRESLQSFLASSSESMRCGDKKYEYFREDIELWLEHISDPVQDYPCE
jgi:hypothetical protein